MITNKKNMLDKYIELAENKGLSENTIKNNVSLINKFLDSNLSLNEYKDYLIETPVTNSKGIENKRKSSSINTTLNILRGYQKLTGETIEDIKLIKIQKQTFLDNVLTEKEFKRIIAACEKSYENTAIRSKALFTTLARTGCRISEALSLERDDIIKLKKKGGLVSVVGKGSKEREIIITKEVKAVLDDYISRDIYKNKSSKLFTTNKGSLTRQTAHNNLKKFTGLAKIKKSKGHLHNLRHLFCINATAAGIKIEDLAQIVGHSDINTTSIYTAKSGKELQKMLETI